MSVAREMLKEAQRPLAERIVAFLSHAPDKAFTLFEIYGGVEGHDANVVAVSFVFMDAAQRARSLAHYREALERLTESNQVECAVVGGVHHYAVVR